MSSSSTEGFPPNVKTRNELRAGDIGYLTYLHGKLYREEQGWDCRFEAYVAGVLSDFVKSLGKRDRIWIVEEHDAICGSVAIVEAARNEARLRCFLLDPKLRCRGIGRELLLRAVDFCRASGYSAMYLWTVSTLVAASKAYRSVGFHATEEHTHELWGTTLTEQRYELRL